MNFHTKCAGFLLDALQTMEYLSNLSEKYRFCLGEQENNLHMYGFYKAAFSCGMLLDVWNRTVLTRCSTGCLDNNKYQSSTEGVLSGKLNSLPIELVDQTKVFFFATNTVLPKSLKSNYGIEKKPGY